MERDIMLQQQQQQQQLYRRRGGKEHTHSRQDEKQEGAHTARRDAKQAHTHMQMHGITVSNENNFVIGSLMLPATLAIPGVASAFSGSNMPLGSMVIFLLLAGILDNCKMTEMSVATAVAGLLAFQFTAILNGAMFSLPVGIDGGTRERNESICVRCSHKV